MVLWASSRLSQLPCSHLCSQCFLLSFTFVPGCDFSLLPLGVIVSSGDKPENLNGRFAAELPAVVPAVQDSEGTELGSS